MADDELLFGEAPSVGLLLAPAALPGWAEGCPSQAALTTQPAGLGLPRWGLQRNSMGHIQAMGSTLVQQQPQPGPESTKGVVGEFFKMLGLLSSVWQKADPLSPLI